MQVTAKIPARELRVGDAVELADGTKGDVVAIRDGARESIVAISYGLMPPTYHFLRHAEFVWAVLEDDGEPMSDITIYGAGAA